MAVVACRTIEDRVHAAPTDCKPEGRASGSRYTIARRLDRKVRIQIVEPMCP
jgi:hypothetical protein